MKTRTAPTDSLPLPLPRLQPAGRRQDVAGIRLQPAAMAEFNTLLQAVNCEAPAVDADQLATLARWLLALPSEHAQATLSERLARAEQVRQMLADPAWQLSPAWRERAAKLVDYLRRTDDLIPDDQPLVGHLDDALLIELSWPTFAGEAQDYRDFCRFRRESKPRGTAEDLRNAWEAECLAEAAYRLHRQEIRQRGYARPEPLFDPLRVC